MKNYIILALFALSTNVLFALPAYSPITTVDFYPQGGQTVTLLSGEVYCGYSTVQSVISHYDNGDTHIRVDCTGTGFERCRAPLVGIICTHADLSQHAENEILAGNLCNSFTNNITENGKFFYRSVVWQSTDIYNISYIVITLREAELP